MSFLARNIGFLLKTMPFAAQEGGGTFQKAIQTCNRDRSQRCPCAGLILTWANYDQSKGRTDEARKYMTEAIQIFEECEADVFLKQAREMAIGSI